MKPPVFVLSLCETYSGCTWRSNQKNVSQSQPFMCFLGSKLQEKEKKKCCRSDTGSSLKINEKPYVFAPPPDFM